MSECSHSRMVEDPSNGEIVCADCGLVLNDYAIDLGPEWRSYDGEQSLKRSRVGPPGGPILPTLISGNKDGRGQLLTLSERATARKLRLTNYRTGGYKLRTFATSASLIDISCQRLHLPDIVKKQALSLFRRALTHNFLRGRSRIALAGACIYAACKQQAHHRSLEEVAKSLRLGKIQLQTTYRHLYWRLDLKPQRDNPAQLLDRIMNQLGIQGDARVRARQLLAKAEKQGLLQGRNPVSIVAACIYMAEVGLTQSKIANIAHVTEVTVRNRVKELRRLL